MLIMLHTKEYNCKTYLSNLPHATLTSTYKSATTDVVFGILSDALVEFSSVEHEEVVVGLKNAALGGN